MGQTREPAEEVVNDALITLRAHSHVFFQINGWEMLNAKQTLLTYNVSVEIDTDGYGTVTGAFLDVEAIKAGVLDHRICGDGVTLWKYTPAKRTYQPIRYGKEKGPQDVDYLDAMLRKFDGIGDSCETRLATLLRQTYAESGANYESWLPGVEPKAIVGNVIYIDGAPPTRGLTFSMTADTNGNLGLATVAYFENGYVGQNYRSLSWLMTVNKDLQFLPRTFVFAPPYGTTAIKGG